MYKLALSFVSLFFLIATPAAAAGNPPANWVVTQLSGDARVVHRGAQPASLKVNNQLAPGDTLLTGPTGRATLVRGGDYIVVAPGSELQVPSSPQPTGFTRVIQNLGTLLFKVQHTGIPHFAVDTPMLAAVVKGTTFTVVVDQHRSAVQVIQGLVQVSALDGAMTRMVEGGRTVFINHDHPKLLLDADKPLPAAPASSSTSVTVSAAGESPLPTIAALTGGLVRADLSSPPPQTTDAANIAALPIVQTVVASASANPTSATVPSTNSPTPTATPAPGVVATTPAATVPGTSTPSVTVPTVSAPAVTIAAITTPVVNVSTGTAPSVTIPTVTSPAVTVPSVSTPSLSTGSNSGPGSLNSGSGSMNSGPGSMNSGSGSMNSGPGSISSGSGGTPTVTVQPVTTPTVTVPSVSTPTVTVPTLTTPTITTPLLTVPSISTPTVTVPTITTPTVAVPTVTTPTVSIPLVTTILSPITNLLKL